MVVAFVVIQHGDALLLRMGNFKTTLSFNIASNKRATVDKVTLRSSGSQLISRRESITAVGSLVFFTFRANAEAAVESSAVQSSGYPNENEIRTVQLAIQAFDRKELNSAQAMFSSAINRWEELGRPR